MDEKLDLSEGSSKGDEWRLQSRHDWFFRIPGVPSLILIASCVACFYIIITYLQGVLSIMSVKSTAIETIAQNEKTLAVAEKVMVWASEIIKIIVVATVGYAFGSSSNRQN